MSALASASLRRFVAPWSLLLALAACAPGDTHDAPVQAAQRLGTPAWSPGDAITVVQRSAARVALSWPAASGGEAPFKYHVYRGGVIVQIATANAWADLAVAAETEYAYQVGAVDAEGRETVPAERLSLTLTTPAASPPPAWPSGAALTAPRVGRNRVELAWPSASAVPASGGDDGCRYEVQHFTSSGTWASDGVYDDTPEATERAVVLGLFPGIPYDFRVLLTDLEGQSPAVELPAITVTTEAAGTAFEWPTGAAATATLLSRSAVRLSWPEGPLDADHYEVERGLGAGFAAWGSVFAHPSVPRQWSTDDFEPRPAAYAFRVRAVDVAGNATAWLTASATIALPPTPAPPPLPSVGAASFAEGVDFLYTAPAPGVLPQQTGVAPGAIIPDRATVLTGVVRRRDGATEVPASGARVTVVGHPELGETWTREDGRFELVVNGGGALIAEVSRGGHLPVQRSVEAPWGEYVRLDDVLLTPEAPPVEVALDTTGAVPAGGVGVQGPVVGSGASERRAAIFLPAGRTATACLAGSTPTTCVEHPLTGSSLHLTLTEYTVGDGDVAAMPGTLPPTTAYTYAVSYRVQEAEALGATRVEFSGPVVAYVDNFLDLHLEGATARAGYPVPMGWYDEEAGRWVPNEQLPGWTEQGSGRSVDVLGVLGDGRAALDVSGDGVADEPPGFNISDDERRWLGAHYAPASGEARRSLWRIPIRHFSSWDANMGTKPEAGAKFPLLKKLMTTKVARAAVVCNSVIECENRALGESIALPGAGASLHYHSTRMPGWRAAMTIPLTTEFEGPGAPSPLPFAVRVRVQIAGQQIETVLPPDGGALRVSPGRSVDLVRCAHDPPVTADGFCWDGRDAFGREVRGSATAYVSIGYVYSAEYGATDAFGYNGGGRISGGDVFLGRTLRQQLVLWTHEQATFEQWDARAEGTGGWTLPMHHRWDVEGDRVLLGHGGAFPVRGPGATGWAVRVAGVEYSRWSSADSSASVDDGLPALDAGMPSYGRMQFDPRAVAVDARGQLHVALSDGRVMRVDAEGRLRLVVDTITDRGLPTQVGRGTPSALAIAGDGTLYVATEDTHRVWRFRDGILSAFAGDGTDGGTAMPPAFTDPLTSVRTPAALAVGADGSVYIAERERGVVRRVLPSGVMSVFAGNGTQPGGTPYDTCRWTGGGGAAPDDRPAIDTWLCLPAALAVGADGSVYVAGPYNVSRVSPDGTIHHIAGRAHPTFNCSDLPPIEGAPAESACLYRPWSLATLPGGYVAVGMGWEGGQNAVYSIDGGGALWRIAGGNTPVVLQRGAPRRPLLHPWIDGAGGLAVDPRGRLHVLSIGTRAVWRLEGDAPDRVPGGDVTLLSPDGGERYTFARDGRHLATHDALTGALRYQFAYDAALRLASVTDAFGNAITVTRPTAGTVVFTGPHGAAATGTLGADGWLASLDAGEWGATEIVYGGGGALSAMRDARGYWHRYQLADDGRFSHDSWGASATEDAPGGRVVSLHPSAVTHDGADTSWSVTTRDGTSLTSGLDTTHGAVARADGSERRTTTPPVGPEEVTETDAATLRVHFPGAGYADERVARSVRSGANGLAWARSIDTPISGTVTPFDGFTRGDARAGALRVATLVTRTVSPNTALSLAEVDAITELTDAVAPITSDPSMPPIDPGVVPLVHGGVEQRWRRVTERLGSAWRVTTTSPRGRQTVTERDAHGRVHTERAPSITQDGAALALHPVETTYDARGRVATVTQGDRRVTWTYDDATGTPAAVRGRVASVSAGLVSGGPARTTTFVYNLDGPRTTRATSPGSQELRTALDEAGNAVSITPPGRTAHTFAYGWRDRPTRYTPPVPGGGPASPWETSYEHEVQGMPRQVTRPDGVYDFAYVSGRLSVVTLPVPPGGGARPTLSYVYDEATGGGAGTGVVTRVTHSLNGVLEFDHDFTATGTLPRGETWRITEGGVETARSVAVGYDGFGRVASWAATGGPTVSVGYDGDGLPTQVGELAITRDTTAGVELGTSLAGGGGEVTTTQRYDAYGAVTTRGSAYGGAAGLSFAYGYDGFGRLTRVTESGEGAGGERWYRYDEAGRLARVCTTEDCGEGADAGASTELERYEYGANGTRSAWTNEVDVNGVGGSFSVAAGDVDAQDRLLRLTLDDGGGSVTFTYDNAGRTQTKVRRDASDAAVATTTLVYDSDGALRSFTRTGSGAASVAYGNDAVGRRIARVEGGAVTARWTYQGIHPVAEYDASWALRRVFVYATRGHVPDYVAASEGGGWALYRVVTDHLGSVRRVVRVSDGVVMPRMRYDAYGRVLQDDAASGWDRVPFGYAGGVYDRVTGLVRFGARDYDPEIGRWTAKDPIGFEGGDGNLYGYCSGVPNFRIDPSGYFPWGPAIFVGIAVLGGVASANVNSFLSGDGSATGGQMAWAGLIGGVGALAILAGAPVAGVGLAAGVVQSLGTSYSEGHTWGESLIRAGVNGVIGGVTGAIAGPAVPPSITNSLGMHAMMAAKESAVAAAFWTQRNVTWLGLRVSMWMGAFQGVPLDSWIVEAIRHPGKQDGGEPCRVTR